MERGTRRRFWTLLDQVAHDTPVDQVDQVLDLLCDLLDDVRGRALLADALGAGWNWNDDQNGNDKH